MTHSAMAFLKGSGQKRLEERRATTMTSYEIDKLIEELPKVKKIANCMDEIIYEISVQTGITLKECENIYKKALFEALDKEGDNQ